MIKGFVSNDYVQLLMMVLTIGSVIFAVVTWLIAGKKKEIAWSLKSSILMINSKTVFNKLEISYGSEKVNNLSVSEIEIRNNGNKLIEAEQDFVKQKGLRVLPVSENNRILDAKVIYNSNKDNHVDCVIDNNSIAIDFDFLRVKDSLTIAVLHTDLSLCVTGTMKDGIIKKEENPRYRALKGTIIIFSLIVWVLLAELIFKTVFVNSFSNLIISTVIALSIISVILCCGIILNRISE